MKSCEYGPCPSGCESTLKRTSDKFCTETETPVELCPGKSLKMLAEFYSLK
jgi:hypothetical protein